MPKDSSKPVHEACSLLNGLSMIVVTPIIIEKYYRHLKTERKDRALQLAKIELEENPGIKSHPYFWAGSHNLRGL
ncbi:MAG: hypothetical protein R2769_15100 [Saprospiraceae bacterium]